MATGTGQFKIHGTRPITSVISGAGLAGCHYRSISLGPVVPSFGALPGRLTFTVRLHKFNKDSPSLSLPITRLFPGNFFFFSYLLLSILELSDTKVYEPYIRACLETAAHFCAESEQAAVGANMAHDRQSRPDSGRDVQVQALKLFQGVPSSLGSEPHNLGFREVDAGKGLARREYASRGQIMAFA